jgi:hypothetical protein
MNIQLRKNVSFAYFRQPVIPLVSRSFPRRLTLCDRTTLTRLNFGRCLFISQMFCLILYDAVASEEHVAAMFRIEEQDRQGTNMKQIANELTRLLSFETVV